MSIKNQSNISHEDYAEDYINNLAIKYVSRYNTNSKKLSDYLNRKAKEKLEEIPEEHIQKIINIVINKMISYNYINDQAYAKYKFITKLNSGYPISYGYNYLQANGIKSFNILEALNYSLSNHDINLYACYCFFKKKKIGPFYTKSDEEPSFELKNKWIEKSLVKGFNYSIIKEVLETNYTNATLYMEEIKSTLNE